MARRHTRFVRPAPKTKIWLGRGLNFVMLGASSGALLASYNAAALSLRLFTILRTRLVIHFSSDQTGAREFGQSVYAEQVVTEVATTAGVGSVPTAITEPNADYLVYQPMMQRFDFITGTGARSLIGEGSAWTVDSKAMRKVDIGDDLAITLENGSAFGSEIAIEGRQLILLH